MLPAVNHLIAFRKHYWSQLDEAGKQTISRLQSDDRMPAAWRMIERRIDDPGMASLLWSIVDARWKADHAALIRGMKRQIATEFPSLIAAVGTLSAFFDDQATLEDEDTSSPAAVQWTENIRRCRQALSWAERYISHHKEITCRQIDCDLPTSQKVGSAPFRFSIALCAIVTQHTGQPLYDFVATVTDTVYSLEEPTSVDGLRAAWTRDQTKRQSIAN